MRRISTFLALLITTALFATPAAAEGFASFERKAADMRGIEPSLYVGKWYSPKHESFRRCVMKRESHGNYRAANKSSSARGAYQFLDSQWRDGLVWMMLKEDKRTGGELRADIVRLRNIPINKWNRYWQDRAFWTAFQHGDGAGHWFLSGSPCNRLA